ncbi:MAG TPA: pyridoxamine 5'-phosphate oxidase family protein, partial [Actinomycetota bacterium]|nr:pyridoxamine 5'-phosphate oxidase family protein [Actinomycetota bacterium]
MVGIGALCFLEGDGQKESKPRRRRPLCNLTTDAGDLHLIVEGEAQRVRNEATLRRASDAFNSIYDWPTVVTEDKLDAGFGAPTSGSPPYDVYEITPTKAFGFPTDGESFTPTRWRFGRDR